MEEYLCVIRQDESVDWFMLCVRDSFFVVACGCKENIIQSIKIIKKRYRTVYGLKEALMNMSEPARCNIFTRQAYEALYKSQKGRYDYLLRDTLEGEYEKIREKRKPKKPLLVKKKTQVEKTNKPVAVPKLQKKPSITKRVMKPLKAKKG